ncbi:hypothetical protein [uncultured Gordonia sp.]|uniref:hypothetical protein n=1 Tax=Gordonia sp. (in: high G+C Gram-positive bacteria) TaxID=84139 RepID=UPI000FAEF3D8|nr:hypothetical protein [uncultured Gordonia sp.]RUP38843.1 MAG: hypothetical protein EKK60_08625 [Gordonia sp. (in: high G+C Gram-positive bacteria)]HNP58424.1 hypothetical protein [Gordonia sp. (in: high G+C Gram-positive bacteria)]
MAAYATAQDLRSRWPALADSATAEVLLEDAALWLRTWFPDLDARIASGAVDAGLAEMISCAMVKRAMLASEHEGQANQQSTAVMGPFTATSQVAYRNPEGNLYLTTQESDAFDGRPSGAVSMECAGM